MLKQKQVNRTWVTHLEGLHHHHEQDEQDENQKHQDENEESLS